MSLRTEKMQDWLTSLAYDVTTLVSVSGDASFRHYYRVFKNGQPFIVMDAPPEHESCDEFIQISSALRAQNIDAVEVLEQDLAQGFLVLNDFGDQVMLDQLSNQSVDAFYGQAMDVLWQMQSQLPLDGLPTYNAELLNNEMELFKQWFLEKLLGIELNEQQTAIWQETKQTLIASALEQPQVFVHRDFHSRNLMVTDKGGLGVLDFQDALKGPMTYDLVSLLRDCYIEWPPSLVDDWVNAYYRRVDANDISVEQFKRWFNLMGIQRHFKAVGIFSRLKLRDHKTGYIKDIPRTLAYIERVICVERSLSPMSQLLSELNLSAQLGRL